MEDGWKKPLFLLNWMEKYNNKVMTKLDAIENMFGTAGEADVAPTDIKSGKKAYNGTTLVTGTMPSNTAEQKMLSCGQSYSIPEGYHDGTGMVSADTLANQTTGTAAAGNVLISKTAYVNGSKVTGTMPEQGAKSKELACGEAYTIPAGHHNGQGKVTAKSLASQTGATAVATKLLAGLTAWVNGNKITGTMANKAGTTVKAAAVTQDDDNTYFAIPAAGYYDTASKVYTENSNLSGKSLKIVHFETGGSGNYKTANIIFDVSNFSTLHFDGTGGIGSGGFAVLGGSGVNIPYGIRQCSLTNSVTLESIGDGGSSKKEYDISKYSYIRLYMRGTPEGYDYIKYFSNISFS